MAGRVSEAPTLPGARTRAPSFDVADLYDGPVTGLGADGTVGVALDEKLRQAYFWIANTAVISPHYDIEFEDGPSSHLAFGDAKTPVALASGQSYSSFVLIPLLAFATRRRCLLVGGPGRGKTATATLMGILAGHTPLEVKRGMLHGHPQLTVADLLGTPLPADLVSARSMAEVSIAWRAWLDMRVRIVDEYNRIPTRTQSALLTVLGDGYAELLDHVHECPPGAWFLTANDDAGGGTYQVIDALKDRIDVVVKALAFNPRFLGDLLERIEEGFSPDQVVPTELVFSVDELDRMQAEVLAIDVPGPVRRRIEHFVAQLEFLEPAAAVVEYMTKDTARLAGQDPALLSAGETGRDRLRDLGVQTRNGVSVRSLMTILVFAKAMAWFRGRAEVGLDDLRQVLPFVLHDKLVPDLDAPFFEAPGNAVLRTDRIGWIRRLFDLSNADHDQQDLDRQDPTARMLERFRAGLGGVSEVDARARLDEVERTLTEWSRGRKLNGPLHTDVLALKYLHQRYTNYLAWLRWKP